MGLGAVALQFTNFIKLLRTLQGPNKDLIYKDLIRSLQFPFWGTIEKLRIVSLLELMWLWGRCGTVEWLGCRGAAVAVWLTLLRTAVGLLWGCCRATMGRLWRSSRTSRKKKNLKGCRFFQCLAPGALKSPFLSSDSDSTQNFSLGDLF